MMSMDRCYDCGRAVDTDDDPGCYIEIGNQRRLHKEVCVCEFCREGREIDAEIDGEPAPSRPGGTGQ